MTLEEITAKVESLLSAHRVACEKVRAEKIELEEAKEYHATANTTQEIVQRVAQGVQEQAHGRIAAVVSRCLSAVFDRPYEFKVLFERKRGRTEARLVFSRDGLDLEPLEGVGGGVLDVAAFALRLACLILSRPTLRRLLVLDEPFRCLSAGHHDRVRELLEALSSEMGVQILMVTHSDGLRAGKVIELI